MPKSVNARIFCATAVALALFPVLAAGDQPDEQQIKKLEQDWVNAIVKRNAAFLQNVEADDYTLTGPDGKTLTKQEDIKNTIDGDTIFDEIKIEGLKVRVYGAAAVVNGTNAIKAHSKNGGLEEELSGPYSWTDVFVKQNGQWKAVATHVTALAPENQEDEN